MFDLKFHKIQSDYNQYFNDINDYAKYKKLMDRTDNRENIINNLFANNKIYDGAIINECINYYHVCKKYFN